MYLVHIHNYFMCLAIVAASQCTVCKRKGIEFLLITEDIRVLFFVHENLPDTIHAPI